jgi:hemerythrin
MINTSSFVDDSDKTVLVIWSEKYATGIELIDNQHRKLVELTNELYKTCLFSSDTLEAAFKDAMSRMVEYVRFHFGAEQKLLERIKYSQFHEHKKQHDELIKNILDAAKNFQEGKHFVPNHFVRTLKDWIFGHIAVVDKYYAAYVAEQKKKGLLTDRELTG